MPRRARGKRVDVGIFQDVGGFTVVAQVGSAAKGTQRSKEERFPLSATRKEMKARQEAMRVDLRQQLPAGFSTGTLGAAAAEYLTTVPEGPNKPNIEHYLKSWCEAGFRDRALDTITAREIHTQLTTWLNDTVAADGARTKGLAPSTVNKHRTALLSLYRVINGPEGLNPVRAVPRLHEPEDDARDPGYEAIALILAQMPDRGIAPRFGHPTPYSLTKIRLTVMAYTGWPQMVIEKIQPHDLARLDDGQAYMRPRRKGRGKGAGSSGHWVPLIPEGVDALRTFARVKAFGAFSRHSAAKSFNVAVKKAIAVWETKEAKAGTHRPWPAPKNVRPYDLRHAYGSEAFRTTGDLQTVAYYLGHADPHRSTRRYSRAALSAVAEAGRDKLAAAFQARRETDHAAGHATSHAKKSAKGRTRPRKSTRQNIRKRRRSA
jgi:hypothetical protein